MRTIDTLSDIGIVLRKVVENPQLQRNNCCENHFSLFALLLRKSLFMPGVLTETVHNHAFEQLPRRLLEYGLVRSRSIKLLEHDLNLFVHIANPLWDQHLQ